MVDSIGKNSNPSINTAKAVVSPTTSPLTRDPSATSNEKLDSGKLSSLSVQLSESATRAASRDASLDRNALSEKNSQLTEQLVGSSYDANKASHDAEVPQSKDSDRLERAKNATEFVTGSGKNPFSGMSRDQLSLIAYDESGDFTVNEKKSAWLESYRQERVWRQQVVAEGSAEYSKTGKLTDFYTSVLDHYKGLPAIEQSQYPSSYGTKLQDWIDQDFNYKTHATEGNAYDKSLLNKILDPDSAIFSGEGAADTES
ncbi:hypothetical protein SAMN05216596_103414 [Pseudomonas congelans]|uniref:Uncharacterized protein n=1 Tax=Pseudomonas congelans TaxID=200452 RepID=A0A0N8R1B1_9PSED|nr:MULTISPECIES: hypothetical protein [Pseudomonas]KPW83494.1 Uncharacterized protein ALO92_03547 [Pseudomonas congelans]MBP1147505.1 hypothetical protein [Pseudomonas sp. PvP027]SDP28132.1 hypothetical protein SAMN05216596_103414 [Pseudomonas congelans]